MVFCPPSIRAGGGTGLNLISQRKSGIPPKPPFRFSFAQTERGRKQAGKNSFPPTPFLFARLLGLRPQNFSAGRRDYLKFLSLFYLFYRNFGISKKSGQCSFFCSAITSRMSLLSNSFIAIADKQFMSCSCHGNIQQPSFIALLVSSISSWNILVFCTNYEAYIKRQTFCLVHSEYIDCTFFCFLFNIF